MNPDSAETALDPLIETPGPSSSLGGRWLASSISRLRSDPARMIALRDSFRALWVSRSIVLIGGVGTVLAFGFGAARHVFDPPGATSGFGTIGNLLAAPVARWDAAWYLTIAHFGYRPDLGAFTSSRTAFFPLYPMGIRAVSTLGIPPVLAGVLVSLAALLLALYGIHRLMTLELSRSGSAFLPKGMLADTGATAGETARLGQLAVTVTALAPMAFFFSAVYSESLYLALSVAVFWCARQGRWAWAGTLGMLAGATRSAGLMLAVPVLILYLYGPREDRVADFVRTGRQRLLPGFRLRRDVLWLALLPAGIALYMGYLSLRGGNAFAPFHAQEVWSRQFAGPYLGIWDGTRAAFDGLRQLLSFQRQHIFFAAGTGSPFVSASHNLMLFAFLLTGVAMTIGVLRRLPLAYGAYVLAALALPLSYPVASQPLMSLPRFELVLFPFFMWLAVWLAEHPRLQRPALIVSAALMVFFLAQFATWHWVA
jgi:Mannosyltransferase (PIG-V)